MIGFFILLSVVIVAIFADQIAPYEYTQQSVGERLSAPSAQFWFGTDELGRDVFSRTVYGTRITLWVAVLGAAADLGYWCDGRSLSADISVNGLTEYFRFLPI